jgi:hypothetical protein
MKNKNKKMNIIIHKGKKKSNMNSPKLDYIYY